MGFEEKKFNVLNIEKRTEYSDNSYYLPNVLNIEYRTRDKHYFNFVVVFCRSTTFSLAIKLLSNQLQEHNIRFALKLWKNQCFCICVYSVSGTNSAQTLLFRNNSGAMAEQSHCFGYEYSCVHSVCLVFSLKPSIAITGTGHALRPVDRSLISLPTLSKKGGFIVLSANCIRLIFDFYLG